MPSSLARFADKRQKSLPIQEALHKDTLTHALCVAKSITIGIFWSGPQLRPGATRSRLVG